MGKPKTQTVGGGAATGVANDWNSFLKQGLASGNFGSPAGYDPIGKFGSLQGPNGAAAGVGQAQGQTQSFGGAINNMLSGRPGDPSSYEQYFKQVQNGGNGSFGGIGNAPAFQGTNFRDMTPQSIFAQMQNAGGFNGGAGAAAGQSQGAAVNFNSGNYNQVGDAFGANGAGGLLNYDINSPEFAALRQLQERQTQQGINDVRARFAAGGGSSLGSGASLAESQYRAEADPRNLLALGDLGRQMQALDMQNRGQNAQFLLGQRGQNIEQRGQNMNADLSAATNTAGNVTQSNVANAANQTQANIASMQASQQGRMQAMAMQLQALGMDQDNAFRAAQAMNANDFNQNQAVNQFNQGNYQFGVNAGMQNQNMQNQYGLGQAQLGLGIMGQQAQTQQAIMNQLFGSYNQANALGTPQARTVQSPSTFGQILNGAGQIANIGTQLMGMKNPFGGGQQTFDPGLGGPPNIQQTPGYPQSPGVVNPSQPFYPQGGYNPYSMIGNTNAYQFR